MPGDGMRAQRIRIEPVPANAAAMARCERPADAGAACWAEKALGNPLDAFDDGPALFGGGGKLLADQRILEAFSEDLRSASPLGAPCRVRCSPPWRDRSKPEPPITNR
jgi:hypothetical protein